MAKRFTKTQATALASKIRSEIVEEYNRRYKEEKERNLEKFFLTEDGAILKRFLDREETRDFINIAEIEYSIGSRNNFRTPSTSTIMNEIIVLNIQTDDAERISKTIKDKFL